MKEEKEMSQRFANFLLVLVTVSWGASYLFTKFAVAEITPFSLIAYRFTLAFLVTGIFFWKKIRHTTKETLFASLLLGTLMSIICIAFAYALKITDASTAGFIMATTVIMVPMIMVVVTHKLPTRQITLGSIVTIIGLALFSIKETLTVSTGMVLCLIIAFLYAVHIILNNKYAKKYDGVQLGVYQLGFTGGISFIAALMFEPLSKPETAQGYFSLVMLALICSAFAVVVQSVAQKYTSAVHTGFIFALEPIFAACFALLFLHEVMDVQELLGACFIFLGVLIANYTPKKSVRLDY